ncbi:MAG TPA: head GIN domain-containing protein [Allosphingosinicella sp.]|jgi:hypothetical protein
MVLAMRIMPFFLMLAAAAPAAAADRVYSVTDFDRVQVDGPYDVTLSTGGTTKAVATGDQAAVDRVLVDVQGRTLRIRPNPSAWGSARNASAGPVRFNLSARSLRSASVVGAGSLAIDRVRGLRVDLGVSGNGRLSVGSVEADTLGLALVGSGTLQMGGKAKIVRATISGTGDFDGEALQTDDLELSASTSGSVAITAIRKARVTALGRGDVEVLGTPACTVTGPAAGQVRCGK